VLLQYVPVMNFSNGPVVLPFSSSIIVHIHSMSLLNTTDKSKQYLIPRLSRWKRAMQALSRFIKQNFHLYCLSKESDKHMMGVNKWTANKSNKMVGTGKHIMYFEFVRHKNYASLCCTITRALLLSLVQTSLFLNQWGCSKFCIFELF